MGLTEKLRAIRDAEKQKSEDIGLLKRQWQEAVDKVLSETKNWFNEYLEQGLFKAIEDKKTIHEELLGAYDVRTIDYEIGQYRLVFEPIGRVIIGSWGRIDVYFRGHKTDKYMLILLGESFESAKWYIAPFQDRANRKEFSKENIEQIIETWIDQYKYLAL